MTAYIDIKANDQSGQFRGYLAVPACGHGPGVVIGQEIFGINANMRDIADRYAEEGYMALVPDLFWRLQPNVELGYTEADFGTALDLFKRLDINKAVEDVDASFAALRAMDNVDPVGLGYVGFCMGGKLAYLAATRTDVSCAVGYYGMGIENHLEEAPAIKGRLVLHFAELDHLCPAPTRELITANLSPKSNIELYSYADVDHAFARAGGMHFNKQIAQQAYERSITALRKEIGPHYDLNALWEQHLYHEFVTKDVPATLATMVAAPYVNHVPTLTGGVGNKDLGRFYQHHFVNQNPPDTKMIPISRTIGAMQIVDEFVMCFTHTNEIDWLLPNMAPTGQYVEIPMLAVVKFRGDKLYHEHIYWDQASVLAQVGLIDPSELPIAGLEQSKKLMDETLPSNELMNNWKSSEFLPIK